MSHPRSWPPYEGEVLDFLEQIFYAISEAGGDRWEWVCETFADADEAVARRRSIMVGAPVVRVFRNSDAATRAKNILRVAGLQVSPDSLTRGGHEAIVYRRRWTTGF